MKLLTLTIKPGSGHDATRWLWYLDVAGNQVAQGVEDTLVECFSAAAVTNEMFLNGDTAKGDGRQDPAAAALTMPKGLEIADREAWMLERRKAKRRR